MTNEEKIEALRARVEKLENDLFNLQAKNLKRRFNNDIRRDEEIRFTYHDNEAGSMCACDFGYLGCSRIHKLDK